VAVVYFECESKPQNRKSFANERLLNACNYSLIVNEPEKDRKYQGMFGGLFRQAEKGKERELEQPALMPDFGDPL